MREFSLYRIAFMLVTVLSVSGCQQLNTHWWAKKPEPVVIPVVEKPQLQPETPEQLRVRLLLLNGEYTLSKDQLLTPVNDNAYMYFSQVLAADPENARAKGGMQGIVMRYVDMARQAAARGHYGVARGYLESARKVDANNLLIAEVSQGLKEQMAATPTVAPYSGGKDEYLLNHAQLNTDHPDIKAVLTQAAKQLREKDGLAMIVARTDVEGRWIYHQLRAAEPGYLVRGDIQLGSPARIKIFPRLE